MKRLNKYISVLVCFMALWLCFAQKASAQEINYKAYSVYVYNFIKYIEWPAESNTENNFVIAIVGDSPIIKDLKILAASKKANGQNIVIRKYATIEEVEQCKILYISNSVKNNLLKAAIEKTKTMSALLITEREGQAKKGAGINFVTLEDETLKFEVNRKVIEGNKLKISNSLMTLGLPVG